MSTRRRLGELIKAAGLHAGLPQNELANKANLSRIYVAKLEGDDRRSPSLQVLERLAKALRVDPIDLLR